MAILIIGKIDPVGGVTIHVSRLLLHLKVNKVEIVYHNLAGSIYSILKATLRHNVIHLHSSNPYFRFLFSMYCTILGKILIQTYHGNIGRFNFIKNTFDIASISLTKYPIVINSESYLKALKVNKSARLISAFLASIQSSPLSNELAYSLQKWSKDYSPIFATNASTLQYDKDNNEIYGGQELIKIFGQLPSKGLIFSDTSGKYKKHLLFLFGKLPKNVFIINEKHDFMEILKRANCLIRATTTDGDSLSIKEALTLGKSVIASDCITRPKECILYKTYEVNDLYSKINNYKVSKQIPIVDLCSLNQILELYKSIDENVKVPF